MLSQYQEPKYKIENGQLVNRQSGQPIPPDEPVIVFRARDVYAATILEHYAKMLPTGDHRQAVMIRAAQFRNWGNEHPDRMKEPDTTLDTGWTDAGTPAEKAGI